MSKPVILCGLGRVGWRVFEFLKQAGFTTVVVDNRCPHNDSRLDGTRLIRDDFRRKEVLEEAGIHECFGLLVVTSEDLVNVSTTLMARRINREVRIVVRVFNESLMSRLGPAIHNVYALSTSALTAPLLAIRALTGQALGTFRVEGMDPERRQISLLTIPARSHLAGWTVVDLSATFNVLVVAHLVKGGEERFLLDVHPEQRVNAGDRLAVCGEPGDVNQLLREKDEEGLEELRWAGWLKRTARVVWTTLREIDLPVKIILTVLLGVIITGTIVFNTMGGENLANSVYHTVSIMATMADMREGEGSERLKIFASVLRFLGAATTAAFTAIVTNYLLRSSLRGALEVRRIPESGHVIVTGLGAIGYRVVDELTNAGERVVAIELSRDNRFVATVRRNGIAVILGDATVPDVLKQANGETAKAVVACTSDDMVNLEVTLLARQLSPQQRVVLLQSDPELARLWQEAAGVRHSVSVPALAAPAFVAGLFGDRVQSVLFVHDHLVTVLDLIVAEEDAHLEGQTVRTIAVDYCMLPVAVVPGDGSPPPRDPMNARLRRGDRVVAFMEHVKLEQFLRHEPVPRHFSVDVTSFPLSAQEWLTLIIQRSHKITAEEAKASLQQLPLCLEQDLTRGQADDLMSMLTRERVEHELRSVPASSASAEA